MDVEHDWTEYTPHSRRAMITPNLFGTDVNPDTGIPGSQGLNFNLSYLMMGGGFVVEGCDYTSPNATTVRIGTGKILLIASDGNVKLAEIDTYKDVTVGAAAYIYAHYVADVLTITATTSISDLADGAPIAYFISEGVFEDLRDLGRGREKEEIFLPNAIRVRSLGSDSEISVQKGDREISLRHDGTEGFVNTNVGNVVIEPAGDFVFRKNGAKPEMYIHSDDDQDANLIFRTDTRTDSDPYWIFTKIANGRFRTSAWGTSGTRYFTYMDYVVQKISLLSSSVWSTGPDVQIGTCGMAGIASWCDRSLSVDSSTAADVVGLGLSVADGSRYSHAGFLLEDNVWWGLRLGWASGGELPFKIVSATTERLVIDTSGRMGVGRTPTTDRLEVDGDIINDVDSADHRVHHAIALPAYQNSSTSGTESVESGGARTRVLDANAEFVTWNIQNPYVSGLYTADVYVRYKAVLGSESALTIRMYFYNAEIAASEFIDRDMSSTSYVLSSKFHFTVGTVEAGSTVTVSVVMNDTDASATDYLKIAGIVVVFRPI